MTEDPIVLEVRNARDAYARRFNYDLNAIFDDLQRRQLESGRKLVTFPPRRPNQVSQSETRIVAPQAAPLDAE